MTTAASVEVADVANLLNELSQVQSELLDLLREKQLRMASGELEEASSLASREEELSGRLQACHDRRTQLLEIAGGAGLPSDSIASLAGAIEPGQSELSQQIKESSSRMRLLQHQSLVNWVMAQRSLLHIAQLLEIVATGGRMQPTYGSGGNSLARGNLLNSEA